MDKTAFSLRDAMICIAGKHSFNRVAFQDRRKDGLVTRYVLKVYHPAKIQVTKLLGDRMGAKFELRISRFS